MPAGAQLAVCSCLLRRCVAREVGAEARQRSWVSRAQLMGRSTCRRRRRRRVTGWVGQPTCKAQAPEFSRLTADACRSDAARLLASCTVAAECCRMAAAEDVVVGHAISAQGRRENGTRARSAAKAGLLAVCAAGSSAGGRCVLRSVCRSGGGDAQKSGGRAFGRV